MIVVVLSNCPPRLRGDLTKWMFEVNTNVYVGQFSARVRDELWARICENVKTGQATMVFSAQGEQKMDFRVHNTTWEPVDFDGIKLMLHPSPDYLAGKTLPSAKSGFGAKALRRRKRGAKPSGELAVLDIETTGLSFTDDSILELGALLVGETGVEATFQALIRQKKPLPKEIVELTGITEELLAREGISLRQGLLGLKDFLGARTLICHNGSFDMTFLQYACRLHGIPPIRNPYLDTRVMARRSLRGIPDLKLLTIARRLSLADAQAHRAVEDCELTYAVYTKLKEIEQGASGEP